MIADGQVAQDGHAPCAVGMANGTAVFVPVPVAHPMQSVLDGPVTAGQPVQGAFIGPLRFEAGQQEHGFLMAEAAAAVAVGPAVQAHGLPLCQTQRGWSGRLNRISLPRFVRSAGLEPALRPRMPKAGHRPALPSIGNSSWW